MKKKEEKLLLALDPTFREKLKELFASMDKSISFLYEVATHDEKTGIYNNKFFETCLDMEIEKTKRGYEELSLIMIDIDFFKKLNDAYGHIKADEVLKKVANLLKNLLRKSDILARFGGEEFMILLPETDIEKAKKLGERIKKTIHSDVFLKKYKVTVSGGITEFKKRDTKNKFKERVDKLLYQAKHSGRDQFVVG